MSVVCYQRGQKNRDTPLKISLIKDIKSPPSLVLYFASPLHISWVQSLYNYTGRQCFHLAHCRLSRLADDGASAPVSCGRKGLFFLCFPCHHSLSLSLFSVSPPLSYRYFMHGLTQSHVDYTTHWHPSSHWDAEREKSALACIHSEEICCHLAQFQSRHMEDMVYRFRQGCEHSGTFALFKQMFLWRTDPVYNPETVKIVSHSHCLYYILSRILSGWFWHENHNTNTTTLKLPQ